MRTARRSVRIVAWVFLASTIPAAADPGAFELLDRVRDAYRGLTSYHDRGEIEIVRAEGSRESTRTLRFETRAEGDVFRLWIEESPDALSFHRALRRDAGGVRLDDLVIRQVRRPAALGEGLVEILDREGFDALVVAAALAGSPAALAEPEAAALEGTEPCGDSRCHVLLLSRRASTHETRLWIDRDSFLIRRLEISIRPAAASLNEALESAGLDAPRTPLGPQVRLSFRVRHEILPPGASSARLAEAPLDAREVEEWEKPRAVPDAGSAGRLPSLAFDDAITVELMPFTTRVVDGKGHPVLDLGPGDFRVLFGGGEVPVASVDWVSSDPAFRDELLEAELRRHGVHLEPVEKRVVFFVQAGLHPSRIKGHLRTLPFARELVDTLQPTDRVAVVAFDSHLKLQLDFTRRHAQVLETLEEAILFGSRPRLRASPGGARTDLARHFDFRAARRAASPEQALEVVGRALGEIPGEKVVIYLGWGMGRFGADGVKMTGDYAPAVAALHASRTTVFVLDVTDAGYHSLEVGLQNVAAQTGGTYAKTSLFAAQATERLAATLTGHYVVLVEAGAMPKVPGILEIRLRERRGRVIGGKFRIAWD